VFEAHNIRYFFYIGGNDSQDTADKISKLAQERGYELRVIGVPKTIDNDLPTTDHTPGYGSVIKFISTTVRELACDNSAMGQHDLVSVLEVMGRNAGWIAAGAALAKRRDFPNDPPHLIYLPEVAFDAQKYLQDVRNVLSREKYCLVVVGEGLVDADGNYLQIDSQKTDAFGHTQLGGVGEYLAQLAEENLGVKARHAKLGISQRAASHAGSKTDADEAFLCGQAAVRAAIAGETDKMVTLVRVDADGYKVETGLALLSEIANGVKRLPREWIAEDGVSLNHHFLRYAHPLIQGETPVPYENGLPAFANLEKVYVDKQLPAHEIS
jgi:ATP-dependent phosphofructokinase / diphosphate-dependent phosphofructokinase